VPDIASSQRLRVVSSSPGKDDLGIDELCAAAEERARSLGHHLGSWEDRSDELATARRAACSICGSVAYIRIEPNLFGGSGAALTDRCSKVEPAPAEAG
jgi:hypothetical protein